MEYGAIDLHKKESQVRIMTEGGEVIDRRIATTRDRFTALFWGRPRDEVVKLEEQARRCTWPRLRAVPKRALLLLRIISCAGTRGATDRARIKVGATSLCEARRLATRSTR
jgi:hypothetical protein